MCFCLSAAAGSAHGGTPDYMPLEQLTPFLQPVRIRPTHHQGQADVYSVGISLWRMLVGQDPFLRVLRYKGQLDHYGREADLSRHTLKLELVSFNSNPVILHGQSAGQ